MKTSVHVHSNVTAELSLPFVLLDNISNNKQITITKLYQVLAYSSENERVRICHHNAEPSNLNPSVLYSH